MTSGSPPPPPAAETRPDPRTDQVFQSLRSVVDPELGDTIVDLGMVRAVTVSGDDVTVDVALTIAACPLRAQIERDVRGHVAALEWVRDVEVRVASMDAEERAAVMSRARWKAREDAPETAVPATTRVLAIASGKGGVGKSSVTVNLAVALARRGFTVGILDADIWGFSVPRLLGMEGDVEARQGKMVPLEQAIGSGRVRVLSMGFLADEEQAIMWRGLVLNRAVQQFLQDAHWGDLDYLLIDLPPGTGDIQMGLARLLPRTELLVVTTPPVAAQKVAARAATWRVRGYLPRGWGDREHERLHLRARRPLRAIRLGWRGAPRTQPRRAPRSAPSRCIPIWPRPAMRAGRSRRRGASSPTSSPRWHARSPRTWRRSSRPRAVRPASSNGWRRPWPAARPSRAEGGAGRVPRICAQAATQRLSMVSSPSGTSTRTARRSWPRRAGGTTTRTGRPGAGGP